MIKKKHEHKIISDIYEAKTGSAVSPIFLILSIKSNYLLYNIFVEHIWLQI